MLIVTAADPAGWAEQRLWQADYRPALGLLPGEDGDWPDLSKVALPTPPGKRARGLVVVDPRGLLGREQLVALARRAAELGIQPVIHIGLDDWLTRYGRFAEGSADAALLDA